MTDSSPVQYVTVTCRVCGTRLDERQSDTPRDVACHMCQTMVKVPAFDASAVKKASKPTADVEGYGLLDLNSSESVERSRRAAEALLIVCPICRARLHYSPKREAHQVQCPDCQELVRVPSKAEARAKQEKDKGSRKPDPVEPLAVPAPTVAPRQYSQWFLHATSHIKREPDPVPPKHLFFSDTFNFPWQRGVVSRWGFLTIGLTAISIVGVVLSDLYQNASGINGFVIAFFALPIIWIAIWTASYACAVWLVVLIDTANGNREIVNWGDQNWREWIIQMVYVEYLLGIAAACAHGVGVLVRLSGNSYWAGFAPTLTVLFPIIALSGLERGGSWNIFSKDIFLSLFRRPLHWLGFLLISTLVTLAPTALIAWLLQVAPSAVLALAGPLAAYLVLIHARLLGRLAWAVGRD